MEKRTLSLIASIADGITAHLVTQARTGLWPAYSEYLLYGPVVQIAKHLKWDVHCEYKLPKTKVGPGDNPRLDFMFVENKKGICVPAEIKWPRNPKNKLNVKNDIRKLAAVTPFEENKIDSRLLIVAGPHSLQADCGALLRPKVEMDRLSVVLSRALGVGKRAWGTTIFEVNILG